MNIHSAARPPSTPRRTSHNFKRCGFRLRALRLCAAAALAGSVAHGATVVSNWTSATSGAWNSDSKWTNVPMQGGFPNNGNGGVATYDAVINATGATYSVNLA